CSLDERNAESARGVPGWQWRDCHSSAIIRARSLIARDFGSPSRSPDWRWCVTNSSGMNDTIKSIVGILEEGKPELQVAAAQVLGELRPKETAAIAAL